MTHSALDHCIRRFGVRYMSRTSVCDQRLGRDAAIIDTGAARPLSMIATSFRRLPVGPQAAARLTCADDDVICGYHFDHFADGAFGPVLPVASLKCQPSLQRS
jgi:hypothetical protein